MTKGLKTAQTMADETGENLVSKMVMMWEMKLE